jgi:hypothetical protein
MLGTPLELTVVGWEFRGISGGFYHPYGGFPPGYVQFPSHADINIENILVRPCQEKERPKITQQMTPSPEQMFCSRCGSALHPGANFCLHCGQQVQTWATYQQLPTQPHASEPPEKKVGVLLGIGIFFMPYIFAWLTLMKGYGKNARALSFIWMIAMAAMVLGPHNHTTNISPPANSAPTALQSTLNQKTPKENAIDLVKLDFKWGTAGFGNIMEADFTIQNPTDHAIKDIEITCAHYAKSGTSIDSNTRTIYDIIPAKGKKRLKNFNMGFIHSQASSSSCKIVDLVVIE